MLFDIPVQYPGLCACLRQLLIPRCPECVAFRTLCFHVLGIMTQSPVNSNLSYLESSSRRGESSFCTSVTLFGVGQPVLRACNTLCSCLPCSAVATSSGRFLLHYGSIPRLPAYQCRNPWSPQSCILCSGDLQCEDPCFCCILWLLHNVAHQRVVSAALTVLVSMVFI